MDKLTEGSIVISTAGRDQGQTYVVKQIVDDYVMLVDGKGKTIAKPKKKKIKHIRNTYEVFEVIGDKFKNGQRVFDAEIYSALSKLNCN